ncbi:MAG: CAP domain-containing protein [Dehalococcoidales bacterium]|nr:CAP domain-containing protein [Dehalococcoidales bacterium]
MVYLQLLVVISAGIYLIRLTSPAILGTAIFSAQEVIDLTNKKRVENGLPALSESPLLEQAAKAKAANMFGENYWAHFAPSGKTPWFFITSAGYKYLYAGENLARDFNDPTVTVNAWMNSSSHRENILDKNFKEIGVAVADGKLTGREGILVVQMFGTSNMPQAAQNSSPADAKALAGRQLSVDGTAGGQAVNNSATVLASRQFPISKGISLVLVGFIFLLFLLETVYLIRRARAHLGGGVLAHVVLLGFLLLVVWYSVSGAII